MAWPSCDVRLIRVVAPHFVAAFETDGIVRMTAPILNKLVGMTDDEAREYIQAKGWRASVLDDGAAPAVRVIRHWESFEVQRDGKSSYFYYDTNKGRRAITGRDDPDTARRKALDFAGVGDDRIEINPKQAGPPPWVE
jgi:hypothetical protein